MDEKTRFVYAETARAIERCFPRSDLAFEFSIELKGKMSIYDALIKAGLSSNFHESVRLVAERFPPERAGLSCSWSKLAEWSYSYDHAEI